eukprot:TRINITY_DN8132_c0_g1_i1.p1 TRINITY_DN8132_c0_g1~~TRINITY_DN8132_c0_g1_i1.p1  ORF type:complete len:188 (+),score=13.93 TRINITY_DN8132_c0_g1_i1:51-614(+)
MNKITLLPILLLLITTALATCPAPEPSKTLYAFVNVTSHTKETVSKFATQAWIDRSTRDKLLLKQVIYDSVNSALPLSVVFANGTAQTGIDLFIVDYSDGTASCNYAKNTPWGDIQLIPFPYLDNCHDLGEGVYDDRLVHRYRYNYTIEIPDMIPFRNVTYYTNRMDQSYVIDCGSRINVFVERLWP